MKRNSLIMIAVATIATAAISMTLAQAPDQEAAQDIGAPLPRASIFPPLPRAGSAWA